MASNVSEGVAMRLLRAAGYIFLGRWVFPLIDRSFFADRNFAVFLLVVFVNGMAVGPFLPFLALFVRDQLDAPQTVTANFRAIMAVFMGISGLFGAMASDRLGPKVALTVGLLSPGVAALVFIIGSPWILLPLAVVNGAGHGLLSIGGETYLVRAAPARRIGGASATYFLGSTMGAAVGAAAGGVLVDLTSFTVLGFVMLAISLTVTASALVWLPRPGPATVRLIPITTMLAGYVRMLGQGYVRPFIAVELLRGIFWSAASLAMPFILVTLSGDIAIAGYFTALSFLAGMVAMLIFGPISDRVGRGRVFVGLLFVMVIGSVLLSMTSGSAAFFFAAGMLATAAAWAVAGQVPAVVKDIARPEEASRMLGLSILPTAAGILLGAQLHGRLTEDHASVEFLILASLLAVALLAAIILFRRTSARA